MGFWSIITPEQTTNLITNPSIEEATTGFTAVGGSIARDTTERLFGLACLKITPTSGTTDGAYYGTVSLTTDLNYTFSVYFKGATGQDYTIYFANTSGVKQGTSTDFTASGSWERQEVTWLCSSTASYRLYVTKDDNNETDVFYIDAVQVEQKAYSTTYCDGEQAGCKWAATSHASQSSRNGQYRGGGKLVNLDDYQFYVEEIGGIGMPAITHKTTQRPLRPGARFSGNKVQPRFFDLKGLTIGTSRENLHAVRKDFIDAIKPDLVTEAQPVVMRYTGSNSNKAVDISCQYDTGFQLGRIDGFTERQVVLRLAAYDDPFFREVGNDAAALVVNQSVTSVNRIINKIGGVWDKLDTGVNAGTVDALALADDGTLYVGGSFTQAGGVSNTGYIAKWDGTNWTALGTGGNGQVRALLLAPNGDLYAGGDFSAMGGVSNTAYIAKWNGSAWSALGTGANNNVHCLALGHDGDLYAGGEFTTMGATSADYAARWDGSAWSDLGANLINNTVRCMATALDGKIWFGGDFTDVVNPAGRVAFYNPINDSNTGITGFSNGIVYAMVFDNAGRLYCGGSFTAPVSSRCAVYDGQGFRALGDGLDANCYTLHYKNGLLYAGGVFTEAGGNSTLDGVAIYNGSSWVIPDCNLPGTAQVDAILANGEDLYLGFNQTGTALVSQDQTITNNGSRAAYPKITINRSGGTLVSIRYIKNETTGMALNFNYDLLDGETLTVNLEEGNRSLVSSYFGTVWRAILRQSEVATFNLLPGANDLSILVHETGSPTITANIQWVNKHWSADGAAE